MNMYIVNSKQNFIWTRILIRIQVWHSIRDSDPQQRSVRTAYKNINPGAGQLANIDKGEKLY